MSGSDENPAQAGGRGGVPDPQAQASSQDAAWPRGAAVVWDDSKMVSFHADVVNIQSTREQVYLFFGTNQTWNLDGKSKDAPVRVELNARMILTPHATKRLLLALADVVKKYESRFGELKI